MNTRDDTVDRTRSYGTESLLLASNDGRAWGGWIACIVLVIAFSIASGLWGAFAGATVTLVWLALGTPYALAAGFVLLLALTPEGIEPFSVLLIGTGFVALLLAPTITATASRAYAISAVSATVTAGAFSWLLLQSQPVWIVAVSLIGAFALATYGLHRYQRLRLGLLDDAEATDRDDSREAHTTNTDQP